LIGRNVSRNFFMLLCVILLFMPLTIGQIEDSINSLQIEMASGNTTHSGSNGGLMNSSWPMFHHDTRHMGRSSYGPLGTWPSVKWKFQMEGQTDSSPAIDNNGTIYIGIQGFNDKFFFAINSNGTEKWSFNPGDWVQSSPALSTDGTMYFGSNNGNLNALNPNGSVKWIRSLGKGWVFSSPAIGNDGTIYAASLASSRLCSISPNGTIQWFFNASDWIYSSPAIDNYGIIYIGSHDHYLYAIYPNGTMKWRYGTGGEIKSSPSIGNDGTIYVCSWDHYLYAIHPNGTLKWRVSTGDATETTPAIGEDGSIYVGSYNGWFFSLTPEGGENWRFKTDDGIYSSPAIDTYGIIYCGSYDGYLYALNPNGTLRWKFYAGEHVESSPVIGEDGTIYIAAYSGLSSYLYALETINNLRPSTPTIDGTASGKINQNYEYTIVSTDPDENNISYYVAWGDGISTGWFGPFPSGEEQTVSHTWTKKGTYTIRVWAMDNYSSESDPGTLSVTMPYQPPQFRIIEWLLERFPNAFPILRYFYSISFQL
jgi:outer membrane protein assembly factor BamB